MRNIMYFGNYSNRDFGVIVNNPPPIPTPQERGESIEIPGQNGDIWKGEGVYQPITLVVPIWVPTERLTQVRGWLTGSGKLKFDAGSLYWDARIGGETHFAPCPIGDGYSAAVTFICQPFRSIESEVIEITSNPQIITNPYSVYSEPLIEVQCAGDFALIVGGSTCIVEGLSGKVLLDSKYQECYQGGTLCNNHMSGAFPVLAVGENEISYSGSVTAIRIMPGWRTL